MATADTPETERRSSLASILGGQETLMPAREMEAVIQVISRRSAAQQKKALTDASSTRQSLSAAAASSSSPSTTPPAAAHTSPLSFRTPSFTGAELVDQLVATSKGKPREECVLIARQMLERGAIEPAPVPGARASIAIPSLSASSSHVHTKAASMRSLAARSVLVTGNSKSDLLSLSGRLPTAEDAQVAEFSEDALYSPQVFKDLSERQIGALLTMLREGIESSSRSSASSLPTPSALSGKRGQAKEGSQKSNAFAGATAVDCWVRNMKHIAASRQAATSIGQELLNKGFIACAPGASRQDFRDSKDLYVIRDSPFRFWGFLLKRGRVSVGWKIRWFLCKDAAEKTIYYFKSPRNPKPQSQVCLTGCVIRTPNNSGCPFKIVTPNRIFSTHAISPESMEAWIGVLSPMACDVTLDNERISLAEEIIIRASEDCNRGFLDAEARLHIEASREGIDVRPRAPSSDGSTRGRCRDIPATVSELGGTASDISALKERGDMDETFPCMLRSFIHGRATALLITPGKLWVGSDSGDVYAADIPTAVIPRRTPPTELQPTSVPPQHWEPIVSLVEVGGLKVASPAVWSGDEQGDVTVWETASCTAFRSFSQRPSMPAVFSPCRIATGCRVFCAGTQSGVLQVIRTDEAGLEADLTESVVIPGLQTQIQVIRATDDGTVWIASGTDLFVYNSHYGSSQRIVAQGSVWPSVFTSMRVSNKGQLWSGHSCGDVCQWDVGEEAALATLRRGVCPHPLTSSALTVMDSAWVDGSAGEDSAIVEYTAAALKPSRVLTTNYTICLLATNAIGDLLAVATTSGHLLVYNVVSL